MGYCLHRGCALWCAWLRALLRGRGARQRPATIQVGGSGVLPVYHRGGALLLVVLLGADVSQGDWTVLALGGLPVVAVACQGMLLRGLVDDEMRLWGLWLVLLLLSCGLWFYIFSGTP